MNASAVFGLLLTACAVGVSDPQPSDDPGPKPPVPAPGPSAQNDGGSTDPDSGSVEMPGISGCGYGFNTPMAMFQWVNAHRQQYSNHTPYDGYPFQGTNASSMTWTIQLAWDATLASEAQAEAERLANGGKPQGQYFPFMNDGNGEGFYTWGLDSSHYFLATRADAALPMFKNAYGVMEPPHHAYRYENGFYRMGVAYQTGAGAYNKKSKLGVGAAEGGVKVTWWVLCFG